MKVAQQQTSDHGQIAFSLALEVLYFLLYVGGGVIGFSD
jgi:hypothetical protein